MSTPDNTPSPNFPGVEKLLAPISEQTASDTTVDWVAKTVALAKEAKENGSTGSVEEIVNAASNALERQSKHLEAAVHYAVAGASLRGVTGVHDGLLLLLGLHERCWDSLQPPIGKGKFLGARIGRLEWMDQNLAPVIAEMPLREDGRTEQTTKVPFFVSLEQGLSKALDACEDLQKVVAEKYAGSPDDPDAEKPPSFEQIHTDLRLKLERVRAILEDRRQVAEGGPAPSPGAATPTLKGLIAAVKSQREDYLKQLREIARFFQEVEPHSPLHWFLTRAEEWARLPLDRLLQASIPDSSYYDEVRKAWALPEKKKN